MTCVHHFMCDPLTPGGGDTVAAHCKHCGEVRDFVAFSPVDLFTPRTATSAERRKAALARIGAGAAGEPAPLAGCCQEPGCDRPQYAKDLCSSHYDSRRRHQRKARAESTR